MHVKRQLQQRKRDADDRTATATYQLDGDRNIESNGESTPDIALVVETPIPLLPSGDSDDDGSSPAVERDGLNVLRNLKKRGISSLASSAPAQLSFLSRAQ